MKQSSIILIISMSILTVLSVVAWNAFKNPRNFVVLYNQNLNICFLVDDGYTYDIHKDYFSYGGGKNKGEMKLVKGQLSPDFHKVQLNGIQSAYKKVVNNRIYEYVLNDAYKLSDVFINVENMPVNLVPYREECSKIMQKFKKHYQIFEGV